MYAFTLIFVSFFCVFQQVASIVHHSPHTVTCSTLVVFGDGLSDDGAEISNDESHGFLRNSNGPIWPEYLKNMLQCENYLNYAYSGARSGKSNFYFENWSGIEWQIEQFTNRKTLRPIRDSIVVLQTGGVIDLFSGETNSSVIINNLERSIQLLLQTDCLSLSNIVLMNLPDLSNAPGLRFAEDGQLIKDTFAVSIAQINTQIRTVVQQTARQVKSRRINLRMFDLNSAMFKAISPLNTTEPFSYQKPDTLPKEVSSHAYFDLWHPTTMVHYEIARELVTFLEDA